MNNSYIVKGGNKLKGNIVLSGAKNVALKVIIAALMFDQEIILENVPRIYDVKLLLKLIADLGGKAEFIEENTVLIDSRNIDKNKVDLLHGSKIRVSFMFLAPLFYKFNKCYIPNPGGCRIGARPIDRIINGIKALGACVEYDAKTGYYEIEKRKKIGGEYSFPRQSHTGTELLIMFSIFADNNVIISNISFEPEIDELINFLNKAGADIKRENNKIVIKPVKKLITHNSFKIISDRNEAVTYAISAVSTKGKVIIDKIQPELLDAFFINLKKVNIGVDILGNNKVKFYYKGQILPSNIETAPHPGFMTDWQQNWAVLMTQAQGKSTIVERVFENRFSYIHELEKLGAKIEFVNKSISNPCKYYYFNYEQGKKYNQIISIQGGHSLHNGVLEITDLRAGATLVIAALLANGKTIINGAEILERGYENLDKKIQQLGGDIKKI